MSSEFPVYPEKLLNGWEELLTIQPDSTWLSSFNKGMSKTVLDSLNLDRFLLVDFFNETEEDYVVGIKFAKNKNLNFRFEGAGNEGKKDNLDVKRGGNVRS